MLPCAPHNGRLSAFFHTRTLTLYSQTSLVYTAPPGENYAMTGKERGGWIVCSSSRSHQAQGTAGEDEAMCSPVFHATLVHEIQKHAARWCGYKHDGLVLRCPFRSGDTCEESKTMRYLQ